MSTGARRNKKVVATAMALSRNKVDEVMLTKFCALTSVYVFFWQQSRALNNRNGQKEQVDLPCREEEFLTETSDKSNMRHSTSPAKGYRRTGTFASVSDDGPTKEISHVFPHLFQSPRLEDNMCTCKHAPKS